MKFLITLFALCMSIAFVVGQQFLLGQFPSSRVQPQFNFNSLDSNVRDPRQNRGPVVFPPSPPDAVEESSGVVVGASGYGFVPPQSHAYYTTSLATPYPAYNYYNSPYSQRFSFF